MRWPWSIKLKRSLQRIWTRSSPANANWKYVQLTTVITLLSTLHIYHCGARTTKHTNSLCTLNEHSKSVLIKLLNIWFTHCVMKRLWLCFIRKLLMIIRFLFRIHESRLHCNQRESVRLLFSECVQAKPGIQLKFIEVQRHMSLIRIIWIGHIEIGCQCSSLLLKRNFSIQFDVHLWCAIWMDFNVRWFGGSSKKISKEIDSL